jgi:hypothetical protein
MRGSVIRFLARATLCSAAWTRRGRVQISMAAGHMRCAVMASMIGLVIGIERMSSHG